MNKRETKLLYNSQVIHTAYYGEINCNEILQAINHWQDLIATHKTVRVLVFDYTDATMTPLSTNDVIRIAETTAILTDETPELVMIGVMSTDFDTGMTNMWRAYSNLRSSVSDDQMHVVRTLEGALKILKEQYGMTALINTKNTGAPSA